MGKELEEISQKGRYKRAICILSPLAKEEMQIYVMTICIPMKLTN